MPSVTVSRMSEDEVLALGQSSLITDSDNIDVDALLDDPSFGSLPERDREGRPIISWDQFQQLQARGVRIDNYSLRMYHPSVPNKVWRTQASKFLAMYGQGYEAVGMPVLQTHKARDVRRKIEKQIRDKMLGDLPLDMNKRQINKTVEREVNRRKPEIEQAILEALGKKTTTAAPRPAATPDAPNVKVFLCAEKYPECPRFFDTESGLKFHWTKIHEGGLKKKTV